CAWGRAWRRRRPARCCSPTPGAATPAASLSSTSPRATRPRRGRRGAACASSGSSCACAAASGSRSACRSCGPAPARRRGDEEAMRRERPPYPPDSVQSVEQLEDLLSEPTEGVLEALARLDGDLIFLGVGGKMGPTLARMARRADQENGSRRRIIGVSRFSSPGERERLESWGVETVACDLLDPEQ